MDSGEAKNRLEGLFKINPEKFKALDKKQIVEMHEKNALDIIYAHFFSMGGFTRLGQTKKMSAKASQTLGELGSKIFEDEKQDLNFDLN